MRLRAWSWGRERSGDTWRSRQTYPCEALCSDGQRLIRSIRARERCALPGFSRQLWAPCGGGGYFMGGNPIYHGPSRNDHPPETHEDGCPGSWYRSRFARSLVRYERSVSGDGVLSENLNLTRCEDPIVLEAVHFLEIERGHARAHNADKVR